MNRMLFLASVRGSLSFAAGGGATKLLTKRMERPTRMMPQIVHIPRSEWRRTGYGIAGTGLRSKMLVSADGATVSVQDGNVP